MAWNRAAGSPLSGGQADRDTLALHQSVGNVQLERSTLWPQTGAGCVRFDLKTNGYKAITPAGVISVVGSTPALLHASCSVATDAAPSSAAGILYGTTFTPAIDGRSYVRYEPDRRAGIYDKNGRLLGKSVSQLAVGASGTPTELHVAFDGLTKSTVWVTIWIGSTVDAYFDTQTMWADMFPSVTEYFFWGEWLPAGVNRGCYLYLDDGYIEGSTTASDAPHLVALERPRCSEPVDSTTIGNYNAWDSMSWNTVDNANSLVTYVDNGELVTPRDAGTATAVTATTLTGTGAAPFGATDDYLGNWVTMGSRLALVSSNTPTVLTFASWDGATPAVGAYSFLWHDANRSHLQSTVAGESFTLKSTVANPIPVGATIFLVEGRAAARMTGGGKIAPNMRFRLSGANSDNNSTLYASISTSWSVLTAKIDRPGGGTWAQGDFAVSTLEWGMANNPSGDSGCRVSLMQGPTVAYSHTSTLALGPTPVSGSRGLGGLVGFPYLRRSDRRKHQGFDLEAA